MANQLKIKQEFLDYIKNGIKDFEIRKDGDLEGIKELIVLKEWNTCTLKNCRTNYKKNGYFYCNDCIKDNLKVKLKLNKEMNAYNIGKIIGDQIEHLDEYGYTDKHLELRNMFVKINTFLNDYFKQGNSLYWYDLEVIK